MSKLLTEILRKISNYRMSPDQQDTAVLSQDKKDQLSTDKGSDEAFRVSDQLGLSGAPESLAEEESASEQQKPIRWKVISKREKSDWLDPLDEHTAANLPAGSRKSNG
ncbi:hypothetical protein N9L47_00270 [Rhodobacteraceae bacterium]|nr:hypothetical protein [Paracoccaceae bacterium]